MRSEEHTSETMLECTYVNSDGKEQNKYIYLDRRPKNPGQVVCESDFVSNSFVPLFGMKLKASSTLNRNSYTIESVVKGSTADEMNFSEFDAVTVKDVKIDNDNEYIFAQIYARRRKKGFLDITMVLATQLDSPYYF